MQRVGSDGIPTRYKVDAYVSMQSKRMYNINQGGTAGVNLQLLSLCRNAWGQGLFFAII